MTQWKETVARLPVGTWIDGEIVRHEAFGAFIRIAGAPHAEGLAHITLMPRTMQFPPVGTAVRAKVVWHDDDNRQVYLKLAEWDRPEPPRPDQTEKHEYDYLSAKSRNAWSEVVAALPVGTRVHGEVIVALPAGVAFVRVAENPHALGVVRTDSSHGDGSVLTRGQSITAVVAGHNDSTCQVVLTVDTPTAEPKS